MFRSLRKLTELIIDFEESVGTAAPRRIAERVAAELQDTGPAWSGTFRNAWRINPGSQDVAITIPSPNDYVPGQAQPIAAPVVRQRAPSVSMGTRLAPRKIIYTIGNASEHRLLALDLVPGRRPPRTAPQDWFETYLQGGRFRQSARVELDRAIREARGGGAR